MNTLILKKETTLAQYLLKPIAISLILAVSAQINVLSYPVPITFQPLVLLFIGLLCSPQTAFLSTLYYVLEIALGFPFASGFSGGLIALFSPRLGYFLGFVLSAYVSAKILSYKRNFGMMWLAALISTIILYVCGITWLTNLFGLQKALTVGLYPFLSEIPSFIILSVLISYKVQLFTSQIKK